MSGNINFNGWINDDGSENYKCRAWVNFNGTGTVAIRASGNVSSITDNGTGYYTVNFATAMPDASYAVFMMQADTTNGANQLLGEQTASSITAYSRNANDGNGDNSRVTVAVFR